jgi:acetyl-CoA carboxylase biotin carboxyl carrier protein
MARKEVRAEVGGTVISILSKPGDSVAEGDTLAFIEAMKMEIPVAAPFAGLLAELRIAEGDVVAEDVVLAIIDG